MIWNFLRCQWSVPSRRSIGLAQPYSSAVPRGDSWTSVALTAINEKCTKCVLANVDWSTPSCRCVLQIGCALSLTTSSHENTSYSIAGYHSHKHWYCARACIHVENEIKCLRKNKFTHLISIQLNTDRQKEREEDCNRLSGAYVQAEIGTVEFSCCSSRTSGGNRSKLWESSTAEIRS